MAAGVGGLRVSQGVVGIIKETTKGGYLKESASFPAYDITYQASGDNYQRKETNTHFSKQPSLPGIGMAELSFKILLQTSGTAGTIPYFDTCMLACGMSSDDYTGPDKIRYKPMATFDGGTAAGPPAITRPSKGYSVTFYNDGVAYKVRGAMGNLVVSAKNGEPIELAFTFRGGYQAVTDATPTGLAVPTQAIQRFLGALLTVHGDTLVTESWSLDLGNVLSTNYNCNDATGVLGSLITDRRPKIKVDPEMETIAAAAQDFFAEWRAGTSGACNWGPIGTANDRLAFVCPATIYNPPTLGEREGIRTLDLELDVVSTGAEGSDFYFELD